ncbi:hypothetical protein PENTCL1PPCAC_23873, partial [Pristionchus entomophagus]
HIRHSIARPSLELPPSVYFNHLENGSRKFFTVLGNLSLHVTLRLENYGLDNFINWLHFLLPCLLDCFF